MDLTNLNKDRKSRRKNGSLEMGTMMFGKVPPQAKDLEEAVLGAIMIEKNAFDVVIEILKPECFYLESNQRIFRAMQGLQQKNSPIDLLTVVEELKFREEIDLIGGPFYVTRAHQCGSIISKYRSACKNNSAKIYSERTDKDKRRNYWRCL